MALDDMFGFTAGARQRKIDDSALRLAALDEKATGLAIKKAETDLAQNEAFLAAMEGGAFEGKALDEEDIPGVLDNMGSVALRTGNFEKGKEYLSAGSNVRNQQSLVKAREAKARHEQLGVLANLYQGVTNEQEWNQANAQFQLLTDQASPFAGQAFSPMLLEQARNATTSEKDQAAIDLSRTRRDLVTNQVEESKKRENLLVAQEEYTRERTKNLEKIGGKPVPSTYVTAVTNHLKDEFEDIGYLDTARIRGIALPLAERVFDKVQNEQLTMSQAVAAVVEEATESGDLAGWTPMEAFRAGEHPDRPMELPTSKKGGLDVTQLKPNKYYITPGGQVFLRTKGGRNVMVGAEEEVEEEEDPELEGEEE